MPRAREIQTAVILSEVSPAFGDTESKDPYTANLAQVASAYF
jgi:hypothetical protein